MYRVSLILFLALCAFGCNSNPAPAIPVTVASEEEPQADEKVLQKTSLFEDETQQRGISFQHRDGRTGKRYYVEISASGAGWLDYDNDGDLDLYLVNGALPPDSAKDEPFHNVLYENRDGDFVEVTRSAGVGDTGYGQGMCIGDYNGDGHLDLMVTNYGRNTLYRNQGDGTFDDVTLQAGLKEESFSTGAAFGDVDGDGDLDLYVANYVAWSYDTNKSCGFGTQHIMSFCRPDVFKGQTDHLYINQGNGTFIEQGRKRGLHQGLDDRGFAVILSDMDQDGDPDILVANDGTANRLYKNDGKGFFQDISEISGLAYNADGEGEAGMGLALADFDGDTLLDPFVTNYSLETNTLYLNRGEMFFEDITNRAGLSRVSYNSVGWGTEFLDYDNDGYLDLVVANGHLMDNIERINDVLTYRQPNHLFKGDGKGFREVTQQAGPGFNQPDISRGLAVADVNDDGRLDLLFTNNNGAPNLLINTLDQSHPWVGLILQGKPPNRHAIGARVQLFKGDTYLGTREVRSGGSFLCQSDLRLHFGLGEKKGPFQARVIWPDRTESLHTISQVNRYQTLKQEP